MPCYSPLQGFKSRCSGGFTFRRDESRGEKMTVPCGGCLGCRLDKSREWAARIVHESEQHKQNCFVTLTYDDETMPRLWQPDGYGNLRKEDFQQFMKRLRWHNSHTKIRYFHCGEYGGQFNRPHYHACLMGYSPNDLEFFTEREGIFLYTSDELANLWERGFITVGELNWETAAYAARYCLKKITGPMADWHYLRPRDDGVAFWLEPEYTTMSTGHRCKAHRGLPQRPPDCDKCSGGIGDTWYAKFKTDLWPSDEVPVPGKGNQSKVPRFYANILERENPELFEHIKEKRAQFRARNAHEYTPEKLWSKYKIKKAQTEMLTRGLEQ